MELNIYQLKWYFKLKIENSQFKMEFSKKKKPKKNYSGKFVALEVRKVTTFQKYFFHSINKILQKIHAIYSCFYVDLKQSIIL